MIESFLSEWWAQITGIVVLVAYLNRQQTMMQVRIESLEKKVESLFILWNKHMDRLLDERNKRDD